jgi:hypothetical protein
VYLNPSQYAVSEVIGYMEGKSAIAVARQYGGKQKKLNNKNLWAKGYVVSTIQSSHPFLGCVMTDLHLTFCPLLDLLARLFRELADREYRWEEDRKHKP